MSTAALHAELTARGVENPTVFTLADTLTRASRLGHALHADQQSESQKHNGHRFVCSRCGGLIAWMPGFRLVHRGSAAMSSCADLIRGLVADGAATSEQVAWLATQPIILPAPLGAVTTEDRSA